MSCNFIFNFETLFRCLGAPLAAPSAPNKECHLAGQSTKSSFDFRVTPPALKTECGAPLAAATLDFLDRLLRRDIAVEAFVSSSLNFGTIQMVRVTMERKVFCASRESFRNKS